jgi:hypothetical protein
MSIIDSKSGDFGSLVEVVGGNLCALLGVGQGRHLLREWAEGEEGPVTRRKKREGVERRRCRRARATATWGRNQDFPFSSVTPVEDL